MLVEYIRYTIPSAESAPFEQAYALAGQSLDASPHCLGYELSRCEEAPDSYILRIEWDSLDGHMQGFRGSEAFRSFFAAIKPYVSRIEEMRHYRVTGVRATRTGG
ncbi:antibiotic biosynthesis monooxygenase family protein [Dyella acidiphila]|uniref:Antibiotic biosynthesis monooxygenase n=1 Tax=Dyella acidiphila TaxID=2775866 RepID=A0ABR9GDN6_9GAMM|nr:antibiotic biosynthesis monooxygenase family protein [Dyella acidiphila]MBE1162168.1 antibiotic biosynthesis monooxygenase [Dyella acidiphila]